VYAYNEVNARPQALEAHVRLRHMQLDLCGGVAAAAFAQCVLQHVTVDFKRSEELVTAVHLSAKHAVVVDVVPPSLSASLSALPSMSPLPTDATVLKPFAVILGPSCSRQEAATRTLSSVLQVSAAESPFTADVQFTSLSESVSNCRITLSGVDIFPEVRVAACMAWFVEGCV
jgi:hypothetical protein